MIVVIGPRNAAEQEDRVNFNSISSAPGTMTPTERDRVTVALEHLQRDEKGMVNASKILLEGADLAGVPMTKRQEAQVMAELRPQWGLCLTEPRRLVDVNTQSEQQFKA